MPKAILTPRKAYRFLKIARQRFASVENYQEFQQFQGRLLIEFFHDQQIDLCDRVILDLGCGKGGYASTIAMESNAKVIGIDLHPPSNLKNVFFVKSNALEIPLADKSVDFILCASLIEHVPDPNDLLKEIRRILKDDGRVYLSFPPFYSPVGGHQFSPFHWFGEKPALWIYNTRTQKKGLPKVGSYSKIAGDWGLYVLTIKKVQGLIQKAAFLPVSQTTRWLPVNFSRIPVLGELLTWHVQFILKKAAQ
jgi:SAM-dependent methyltransferase